MSDAELTALNAPVVWVGKYVVGIFIVAYVWWITGFWRFLFFGNIWYYLHGKEGGDEK